MITYHPDLVQGSEEWHAARCGLITASEMSLVLTPTLKVADNAKTRQHVWELAAQRISQYVEPTYIGDAMLRGHEDEIIARELYSQKIKPVKEVGFVTNDKWGFTLGASPDGLVEPGCGFECKSRIQKYQVQTIVEYYRDGTIPSEFVLQVQTCMLVCERPTWDLVSFSGGLPMAVMEVKADPEIQAAIIDACAKFEARINAAIADYHDAVKAMPVVIPTERRIEEEMIV